MALQGTLDTFALPDVLRLLAATKKTGRLHVNGDRGQGTIEVDGGAVASVTADRAPHATEAADGLFELLRFRTGSFTFDTDVQIAAPTDAVDVELLLDQAETVLSEWREIEAVVPSLDSTVRLRRNLEADHVTIPAEQWATVVALAGGITVRELGEELALAEMPASRAVRDLVALGIADVTTESTDAPTEATPPELLVLDGADTDLAPMDAVDDEPTTFEAAAVDEPVAEEPERFVPLDLPGAASPAVERARADESALIEPVEELDDLAAAFPGLANRIAEPSADDEELARQLATLSPRAAEAVRAAAEATTDEEREAALDEVAEGQDGPINRGLLLKFLSSVKS